MEATRSLKQINDGVKSLFPSSSKRPSAHHHVSMPKLKLHKNHHLLQLHGSPPPGTNGNNHIHNDDKINDLNKYLSTAANKSLTQRATQALNIGSAAALM